VSGIPERIARVDLDPEDPRAFRRPYAQPDACPSGACFAELRGAERGARVNHRQLLGDVVDRRLVEGERVRKHLENAYAKLGVHTRTAAVAAAFMGT
jgi:hypothetical protein